MNLEKLQGWLAILANVGVVVGLVLLIVELDQTNKQTAAATYQARIGQIDAAAQALALSDYLPEIYIKLEQGGVSDLSPTEQLRLENWEFARYMRLQGQFFQYQQGYLDEQSYNVAIDRGAVSYPLWKELGMILANPQFVEAIEAEIEKSN